MVAEILRNLGVKDDGEPLCIRFVNTVGSRHSAQTSDRFSTIDGLESWLRGRNLFETGSAVDEAFRLRSIELREAIYGILSAIAHGNSHGEESMDTLNGELCEALVKLEIGPTGWVLTEDGQEDRALMLIALSAADLLSSPLKSRVRECADPECGWIFIDHSKNRSRRWCSMSDCGNVAKARRFQAKRKGASAV